LKEGFKVLPTFAVSLAKFETFEVFPKIPGVPVFHP